MLIFYLFGDLEATRNLETIREDEHDGQAEFLVADIDLDHVLHEGIAIQLEDSAGHFGQELFGLLKLGGPLEAFLSHEWQMEAYVLDEVTGVSLEVRSGCVLGDGLVEVCVLYEVLPVREHELDEVSKAWLLFRQQVNQLEVFMEE